MLGVKNNQEVCFSVIIPVYATEQFLTQCLISVKNQNYDNFECLVINDGSPTKNGQKTAKQIFESIVGSDLRFRYYFKENGGLSDARNYGIERATGRYLVFVDSDDWLELNHLQRYADQINKIDSQNTFTIFNFPASHYHNDKKIPQFIPKHYSLASLIHRNTFLAWSVLFDANIIKEFKLKFDTRLGRGSKLDIRISDIAEDEFFALQYVEAVIKKHQKFRVKLLPHSTYNYREVDKNQKNDEQNRSYLEYAKLVKSYFANKKLGWQVKVVSNIFPYWIGLRFTKNKFTKIWRKVVNIFLRLISGCY